MVQISRELRETTGSTPLSPTEFSPLADPMALVLANAARQTAEFVGLPEAQIPLAEATIYIATANKSNSACISIAAAIEDVKTKRTVPVPKHLRDSHYQSAEKLGHGTGYKFAHDHPNHFVAQDYLGVDKTFYNPTEQGMEIKIKERLDNWRKQFREAADKNVAA
jgi:putative ATPase